MRQHTRLFATLCVLGIGSFVLLMYAQADAQMPGRKKVTAKPKFGKEVRDIFFPDAFGKIGPGDPPGGKLGSGKKEVPIKVIPDTPAPTGGEGKGGWDDLIAGEELEAEIKSLVNAINANIRSAGAYRSRGYKKVRSDLTTATIMFGVIANYKGEVRWKDRATGMRNNLAQAAADSKTSDQYNNVKVRFQSLEDLVRGSQIDVAEGKPDVSWATIADIDEIMKRLELAQKDRLKPNLGSEEDFKGNLEVILHEASIIAVLAQVIQDKGYDAAGEDDYLGWAKVMQKHAVDIVDACKQSQYQAASTAISQLTKSCSDCHGAYR